ncbi:MAG: DUF3782 domain-containing protein [bacterium]
MDAQELEKSIQEIWALFKDTDRRFKETDRRFKETSQEIAALTGKWGRFVEGLLVPAVECLFKQRGIPVDKISQHHKVHKDGQTMEIDILAINEGYAVLIEAKSSLSVEDVKEHLQTLAQFKRFFPEYTERKVIGAVAGIVIEEGADRYAYKSGLFVIGQSGETVKILNDKKFVPRTW